MVNFGRPLDVGICYSGPYAGSWISGPSESTIKAAFDDVDDQMYSWSWDFQPFQAEFGIPLALTRRQALDRVSEWKVNWASPDVTPLARAMLFDDTGFEERVFFFGLIKRIELRPIGGVDFLSNRSPIKLQSVRSAKTFKIQIEQSFPSLRECDARHWAETASELLEGVFVEIDRRGCLTPAGDSCEKGHIDSDHGSRSESLFGGEILSRSRELAGSEKCLAFVPHGAPTSNVALPIAPWTWLRELQG